jgi:hypothetical protein
MSLWNHIGPRNLIHLQQIAALKLLERRISEDHAAGYCVDELLDQRAELVDRIKRPVA